MGSDFADRSLPDASTALDAVLAGMVLDPLQPASRAPWRRRQVRWEPGVSLEAVYTRDDVATAMRLTATPGGLAVGSADDDPDLPGVATVRALAPGARVIAYKPGQTCVLGDGGPVMWKVFVPAALDGVARRWDAVHRVGSDAGVRIPSVRVLDRDRGVLEMATLAGDRLREVAHEPQVPLDVRADSFRALGRALAALAAAGAGPWAASAVLAVRRLDDDAADVLDAVAPLAAAAPGLAAAVRSLVGVVLDGPDPLGGVDPVTAHGALRPDQVLLRPADSTDGATGPARAEGGIGLVDLDGACRALPERDLANLTAYLWWRGVRRPGEATEVARLGAAAVEGAADGGLVCDRARLDRLRALALLKIAVRRYRAVDIGEWPLVARLVAEAERLAGGLR